MTRRILQVVALAFSLTLAGGFVYVKAGGAIPGLPFNQRSEQPPTPMIFSGSKSLSGTTTVSDGGLGVQAPPVLTDSQDGAGAPPPVPNGPPAELLPGSKSLLIAPLVPVPPSSEPPGTPPLDD